jgi:hypothetical protein
MSTQKTLAMNVYPRVWHADLPDHMITCSPGELIHWPMYEKNVRQPIACIVYFRIIFIPAILNIVGVHFTIELIQQVCWNISHGAKNVSADLLFDSHG